ncbi:unannotated protein [freshwater metagenome]|uniref:Unannotated protein n=1 Tax=freshwater metagenome TaxID=449393 RepID=A0A6J7H4D4_9ZZZZ|nr:hypothetical protein [Actinomycetota bacterium]
MERPNAWLEQLHAEGSSSNWQPHTERWATAEFIQWAQDNDPDAVSKIQLLISELETHGGHVNGGRATTPSFNVRFNVLGVGKKWPLCMYSLPQRGSTLEIRFGDFRNTPDVADAFVQAVCSIPEFGLDAAEIRNAGYRKRPQFAIKNLSEAAVRSLAKNVASALQVDNS